NGPDVHRQTGAREQRLQLRLDDLYLAFQLADEAVCRRVLTHLRRAPRRRGQSAANEWACQGEAEIDSSIRLRFLGLGFDCRWSAPAIKPQAKNRQESATTCTNAETNTSTTHTFMASSSASVCAFVGGDAHSRRHIWVRDGWFS